jgi:MFS family permease
VRHTFRSLRIRNYRLFATGQLISLIGSWMQTVGQDWLVIEQGGRGTALGLVTALQFLPILLIGMYGGMLADRYPKRRILLITQVAYAVLAGGMFVLIATDVVQLWMVFVFAGIFGVVTAIDMPARQSFVVEMVGSDDLVNAVSLNSATFNSARLIGPAVAGVMIANAGVAPVFLINAMSYVAVIAGLLWMRTEELHPSRRLERGKGQLREAVRYVRVRPNLLLPVVLVGIIGMFGFNFQITLALYAKEVYERGAGTYGALSSLLAAGSLCGALLAARRMRPRRRVLLLGAVSFGALEMIAGFAPNLLTFSILLVPTGIAMITFASTANATVQLGAGEEVRGRVMALYSLVFLGGTPIGAPIIGWFAEELGPRSSLIIGGAVSVLATLAAAAILLHVDRQAVRHPREFVRSLRSGVTPMSDALR